MTKRKTNLFERIKQTLLVDGGDMNWWVDEEDLHNHQDDIDDDPTIVKETRELSGKQWNEFIIGNVFDDHQGEYLDEDCEVCGHLLVKPYHVDSFEYGDKIPDTMKHCSDCEWVSPELKIERDKEDEPWVEPPHFKIAGESAEDFIKRHQFSLPERKGSINNNCVVCKKTDIPPSDWYETKDVAIVVYGHEGCENGPAMCLPLRDNAERWKRLMGDLL